MKKQIALLLSLALLFSLLCTGNAAAAGPEAEEEELQVSVPTPEHFEAETAAQAFAVAMACWDNGYEERDSIWPPFGWEATGWYAAWLHRVEGIDLLPVERAKDFQKAIGMAAELGPPEDWLGMRTPELFRTADGSLHYNFREYKLRMDELLGVELEFALAAGPELTESAVITQHFGYREQAKRTVMLTFEENPEEDSSFPWRLSHVSVPKTAPVIDPDLTFDWELLTEANSLKSIFSIYPSIRSYSKEYDYGGSTWLFLLGDEPILLTGGEDYYSGRFRGCDFEYAETEDGSMRARIGAIDRDPDSMAGLDRFILDVFSDASAMRLDRIEDGLIWADVTYPGGFRQKLAFDYATMVLREAVSLGEDGHVLGSTVYEYQNPAPELDFLSGWNKPLRTVEVLWESYPGGSRELRTETVEIPADWEYLPYEARWGDYTPYTNDQYIGDYVYPGDGADYLLFLTTVKG